MGCGDDLLVSVLAFYSDNPSLNTAEVYSVFNKNVVGKRTKIDKKRPFKRFEQREIVVTNQS